MQTETVIIGQGICGSLLGWFLQQRGHDFLVVDEGNDFSASRIAQGIINPVSGRLFEPAWRIAEVIPFAQSVYTEMEKEWSVSLFSRHDLADVFPSPQMRLSFLAQTEKGNAFLELPENEHDWNEWLHTAFGYGIIRPVYQVNMRLLLTRWRSHLQNTERLVEARFQPGHANVKKELETQLGIRCRRIVFCDGAAAAVTGLFRLLPFSVNKGELLLVRVPGLPATHILKKTYSLAPYAEDVFYWGASYAWNMAAAEPTTAFREEAERRLKQLLKLPFTVEAHYAALRPATVERRPFAGFHPLFPDVGLLNGMGSKGASLAPFMAHQLAQQIVSGQPLLPETAVERYQRVLMR